MYAFATTVLKRSYSLIWGLTSDEIDIITSGINSLTTSRTNFS